MLCSFPSSRRRGHQCCTLDHWAWSDCPSPTAHRAMGSRHGSTGVRTHVRPAAMTSQSESPRLDPDLEQEDEQLRRIQTVTEASLAHLEIDELLDTLLERVREILEVDTAAILLIDRASREMVATAAKGI